MASYEKQAYDVEQHPYHSDEKHRSSIVPDETGAVSGEVFTAGNTTYAKLQRMATKFGVEARGIERVPEDERTDKSTLKVGTMVCASMRLLLPEHGASRGGRRAGSGIF